MWIALAVAASLVGGAAVAWAIGIYADREVGHVLGSRYVP